MNSDQRFATCSIPASVILALAGGVGALSAGAGQHLRGADDPRGGAQRPWSAHRPDLAPVRDPRRRAVVGRAAGGLRGAWRDRDQGTERDGRLPQEPEATAETIRDGWLYTGDVGYCDADGYFFIVDRSKDMIVRGGENIYPREIEEVLYAHEAVSECAVIGVPDRVRGEEVLAVVAPKAGRHA